MAGYRRSRKVAAGEAASIPFDGAYVNATTAGNVAFVMDDSSILIVAVALGSNWINGVKLRGYIATGTTAVGVVTLLGE